tara:strand:+ start:436 stop:708 length:273 start_codon:yes stop_codon:yes gene_type:complete
MFIPTTTSMATYNRETKTDMTSGAKFPWKKSVTWADQLENVVEFELPFRKGSYGELSAKIGKPQRVIIPKGSYSELSAKIGKPQRIIIKC